MTEKYESLVQRQDFGNQARNFKRVRQQRLIKSILSPGKLDGHHFNPIRHRFIPGPKDRSGCTRIVKAKEADVNPLCIPGAKADEPRRSGLLLECCHACLNSVDTSVSRPIGRARPLEFQGVFPGLVVALEVRWTTEDDGITACFVSPQAFKTHWFIMQRMRKNMDLGRIAWSPYIALCLLKASTTL
jgi:hypothetical protein